MKFKKLTEDDILHAKDIYYSSNLAYDERISSLMEFFGKGEKTTRNWLIKLGIKKTTTEESPQFKTAKKRKVDKNYKRFIFTWAQNNTPVHEVFLRNIEAYSKEIDAEIHIIAGRYKNPTSVFDDKDFESWHSRVEPYLFAARQNAHKHLIVCGDVKISPTATNPMTAMEGFSGPESSIFGHPKMQMKMVAALEGTAPKMMMTTGAVTLENYTDSKAGKKGEFHHTLGFIVVEIKDKEVFYTRQVTATENGNFNDLYYNVSFDGNYENIEVIPGLTFQGEELVGKTVIKRNKTVDGAILGDIHFGETDKNVMNTTLNVLFKKLKPKKVVLHDVFDGHSISHHDRKDAFAQYKKEISGKNDLKKEIDFMLDGLEAFKDYKTVIVRSNHDDFLDRWLRDVDWRKEATMKNSLCYMNYAALLLGEDAPDGVIPYLINERFPNFITLGRSHTHRIHEWEVGQHGDVGASGSRGSIVQFRKLSTKMIIGHSHSPGRMDGVIQVGTSTILRVGYNIGASPWLQSHSIIHSDGKAQQIHFIRGCFTTFD